MKLKEFFKERPELVLRIGLALPFLIFGFDKFIHVYIWTPWIPQWLAGILPITPQLFMYVQGTVEVLIGLSLISGFLIVYSSAVASIMLLLIIITMGYNFTSVRDLGLLMIAVYLLIKSKKN